jgi:hypothetical protein
MVRKEIKRLVDDIKAALKDENRSFVNKYFCLKMLRECLLTRNQELVAYTQSKIMERLGIMAKSTPSGMASYSRTRGIPDIYILI